MNESESDIDDPSEAFSGIEYDSAVIWSDDPEKAYFRSLMNDRANGRAAQGIDIEDSLIGDSTLADMMDDHTLHTFDPPRLKMTGSTGLSLEEDDTFHQIEDTETVQTAIPARSRALGWFTKRITNNNTEPTSPLVPQTTEPPVATNPGPPNKDGRDVPQDGVEVPGFIFVSGAHSAITTGSAARSSNHPDPQSRRRKYLCTARKTICFLGLCIMVTGSMIVFVFRKRKSKTDTLSLTGPMINPTPPPAFDFPADEHQTATKAPGSAPTFDEGQQSPVAQEIPTANPTAKAPVTLLSQIESLSPSSAESLSDPFSPQSVALGWLDEDPNYLTYDDTQALQRFALSTLFLSTSGDQWSRMAGWKSETTECEWEGVECNNEGLVVGLSLKENNLAGSLPAELSLLSSLVELSMNSNNLQGTIPSEIGLLTALERIQLTHNQFSGILPTTLGKLTNTVTLAISHNKLQSTLPSELGSLSLLSTFDPSNNRLTGEIPSTYGGIVNLELMDLGGNALSGRVPSSLGKLMQLQTLKLARNHLTGEIPFQVCQVVQSFLRADCAEIFCSCCTECCVDRGPCTTVVGEVTRPPQLSPPPPLATPTLSPTMSPVAAPVSAPSPVENKEPTKIPVQAPTVIITTNPTKVPLIPIPTRDPTIQKTATPTKAPVIVASPTRRPTPKPTRAPTTPTTAPVIVATAPPTRKPTPKPTRPPTIPITSSPTKAPVIAASPTRGPTPKPTLPPKTPTKAPVIVATAPPTRKPTPSPTRRPTPKPTPKPTPSPTRKPTPKPTRAPTKQPVPAPVPAPAPAPIGSPTTVNIVTPTSISIGTPTTVNIGTPAAISFPTSSSTCDDWISTDKQCYENGDDLVVSFKNCNPEPDDWIGVYHEGANRQDLGAAIVWVWSCGTQFCQGKTRKNDITIYGIGGRGRFRIFMIRRQNGEPNIPYAESATFQVGDTCVGNAAFSFAP